MLLIRIIVVDRIILQRLVDEHRFWKTVPMLHRIEAMRGSVEDVRMGDGELRMVHGGFEALFFRLVKGGPQHLFRTGEKLDADRAQFLAGADFAPRLFGRIDFA